MVFGTLMCGVFDVLKILMPVYLLLDHDMMEYFVMIPSSLADGFLCDGLEVHGKYLV